MYRFQKQQPALLSTIDIRAICDLMSIPLIDVYPKDLLSDYEPEVGFYVVNLEDSNLGGSHWVCIVLNEKYVSYFDSFAVRPSDDIKEFISRFVKNSKMKTIYNLKQIQHSDSVLCGYFCIYFGYFHTILHRDSIDNTSLMNKHNNLYVDIFNLKFNDRIIQKLIKNIVT